MLGNTEQALEKFSKGVIKQSRSNLTRKKKNVDKDLYKSLRYDLEVNPNSFSLKFYMNEYGNYQDEGVKGANPSLVKGGKQKAPNSKFAFKGKRPPIKPIQDWVKKRNIRFRDDKGRFKKGSTKSLAFLISRSIYAQGIKPSRFFSRAFEVNFKNLPQEVVEAYALDLRQFMKFTDNESTTN
jgi:hypothetical protein